MLSRLGQPIDRTSLRIGALYDFAGQKSRPPLVLRLICFRDSSYFRNSHPTYFGNLSMHRATKLPTTGYVLVVDGHLKTEFKTKDGARKGAEELKRRFPMLQVKIYDAEAKRSDEI
jgi:hypothetical protein